MDLIRWGQASGVPGAGALLFVGELTKPITQPIGAAVHAVGDGLSSIGNAARGAVQGVADTAEGMWNTPPSQWGSDVFTPSAELEDDSRGGDGMVFLDDPYADGPTQGTDLGSTTDTQNPLDGALSTPLDAGGDNPDPAAEAGSPDDPSGSAPDTQGPPAESSPAGSSTDDPPQP